MYAAENVGLNTLVTLLTVCPLAYNSNQTEYKFQVSQLKIIYPFYPISFLEHSCKRYRLFNPDKILNSNLAWKRPSSVMTWNMIYCSMHIFSLLSSLKGGIIRHQVPWISNKLKAKQMQHSDLNEMLCFIGHSSRTSKFIWQSLP